MEATNNYHAILAENRRLFNEVQELKGASHMSVYWIINMGGT